MWDETYESVKEWLDEVRENLEEMDLCIGTCQSCGAYWDVCQRPVCPCGGEVL